MESHLTINCQKMATDSARQSHFTPLINMTINFNFPAFTCNHLKDQLI